jgi:hypothetical protein
MPGARELDETDGYVVLIGGRTAAALACKFESCLRTRERQHPTIDERIVNDNVGLRETSKRIERQQPRISRSGSREPDVSRCEHRSIGAFTGGGTSIVHRVSPQE